MYDNGHLRDSTCEVATTSGSCALALTNCMSVMTQEYWTNGEWHVRSCFTESIDIFLPLAMRSASCSTDVILQTFITR